MKLFKSNIDMYEEVGDKMYQAASLIKAGKSWDYIRKFLDMNEEEYGVIYGYVSLIMDL